jgi:hypothetical protein
LQLDLRDWFAGNRHSRPWYTSAPANQPPAILGISPDQTIVLP